MKFLSDIDVEQGSEVLLGSGEYLSWGTMGVTSIEGSTASNRLRFYTSSTLSLTLDSSQNATFAANASVTGNLEVSGGGITLGSTGRIQGIDTVSAPTDAASKAYVDASGGGGGTIGGTTTATEIAFGSATASTLDSDPGLVYTSQNGLTVGDTTGSGNAAISMNKGSAGQARFQMQDGGTEKFSIKLDNSEDTYITAVNTLEIGTAGTTKDIILNPTGDVGVGNTSPTEKLDVTGRIKASKGVQVGNETGTSAVAGLVGTLRYRTYSDASFDYSAVDVCMQDGAGIGDYDWVNIVTKRW